MYAYLLVNFNFRLADISRTITKLDADMKYGASIKLFLKTIILLSAENKALSFDWILKYCNNTVQFLYSG